MRDTQKELDQI